MTVAVIRADSSKDLGGGHIFRCLTLADSLKQNGWYVHFICRKEVGNLSQYIVNRGFGVSIIAAPEPFDPQQDAKVSRELITQLCADLLIVDHYQLDAQWHRVLSPLCRHILVIDDLANRPYHCDILFDQSLARTAEDYQPLLDSRTQHTITGAEHALLREQFITLKPQAITKRQNCREIKQVLVAMGATDPTNVTLTVLQLLDSNKFDITVILTDKAKHLSLVESYIEQTNIKLLINVENMAEQVLAADIAIAASGTSMLERCSLGLPSVLLCLAENQRHIANAVKLNGSAIDVLDVDELQHRLIPSIEAFVADKTAYQRVSDKAFSVCHGNGVAALTEQLNQQAKQSKVYLRPVQGADMMDLFEWQQHEQTRRYSRDPKPPMLAHHRNWFRKITQAEDVHFYIICRDRTKCGYVRLNPITAGYEVSIAIAPDAYGQGLGHQALIMLGQLHPRKNLKAFIEPANTASVKAFTKAGFSPIGENWYQLNKDKP